MDINKKIEKHMEKIAECQAYIDDLKEGLKEAELKINKYEAQLKKANNSLAKTLDLEGKISQSRMDQYVGGEALAKKEKRLKFLKRMWTPI